MQYLSVIYFEYTYLSLSQGKISADSSYHLKFELNQRLLSLSLTCGSLKVPYLVQIYDESEKTETVNFVYHRLLKLIGKNINILATSRMVCTMLMDSILLGRY